MRIGIGYDVHRFAKGRDLILGGVKIDADFGLVGHSDADVLAHAIADALLGAAGLGDLGQHFPDTDPSLKGISSLVILKKILTDLKAMNLQPAYIDSVIIAETPKLAPYKEAMKKVLCETLELETNQLNIKATTEEGLGFTGKKEGMAAWAVASLAVRVSDK